MSIGQNGRQTAGDVPVVRNNFNINHPAEEMVRHQGRVVAWSMDGRRVLASADDYDGLFAEVRRLGLKNDEFVIEYVRRADELFA